MPTYNFRNTETGEEFEVIMKISELDAYKEANPTHQQYLTTGLGMISDHKSTLTRAGSEWQDHLKRIKKGAGRHAKMDNI